MVKRSSETKVDNHGYRRRRGSLPTLALLGVLLWLCSACGESQHVQEAPAPAHHVAGCSPLASGQCVTPFPNMWFEEDDASTATGVRVVFPDGTLPANSKGDPLRQSSMGALDGFSPATTLIAWFPQGVDASGLTPLDQADQSIAPENPIALVDLAAGARVPFFAELDANATDPHRQALLIHPLVRLKHATRYAVAITNALHDAQGQPLAPEGAFADWLHGDVPPDAPLAEIAPRLDADAAAFTRLGIARAALVLAWDFDTAGETHTTARLLHMRDQVLAAAPRGLGYSITSAVEPEPAADPDALRIIDGTFQAPSFEIGVDPTLLRLGPDGEPVMGAPADWPFTAIIPRCAAAAAGPVPLLIIGHGLFDTAQSELMNDRFLLEDLCMVGIGTDFLGTTSDDFLLIGVRVLPDLNNFGLITDRLQQAHMNFQVLTRLAMNGLRDDAAFQVNGHPAYDPASRYYWGASNGGIQGATYLALSPDVPRGVLNVPGAEWSLMMWRSSHFSDAFVILDLFYPDKLDQQLLIALTQTFWDHTDPIEFAPHLAQPLAGVTPKDVLFQEALGDAQVPNVATRVEMRTLGATGLAPLVEPVFGINAAPGPLRGIVYTQWDVKPTPLPPATNTPPQDNAAHEAVRRRGIL